MTVILKLLTFEKFGVQETQLQLFKFRLELGTNISNCICTGWGVTLPRQRHLFIPCGLYSR